VIHDRIRRHSSFPRFALFLIKKNCDTKNGLKKFPQNLAKVVQFSIGKTHFHNIEKKNCGGKKKSPILTNGSLEK
jgi:hypothetical protein